MVMPGKVIIIFFRGKPALVKGTGDKVQLITILFKVMTHVHYELT